MLCAGGRYIDKKYLNRRPLDERQLCLRFPNKDPTRGDFRLWEEALLQLAPGGRVSRRLGKFVAKPHKIWEWRQCTETNRLFRHMGHKMEIYCRTQLAGQRGTNKYSLEL